MATSNNHKKYDKSRVFKTAWQIWRKDNTISWSECLKQSWNIEKNGMAVPTIEQIFNKHYSEVYRYICSRVKRSEDAEELASEVFIRCNKHLAVYDVNKAKLTTWLYTIANNLIIDHYRKADELTINVSRFADAETGKEIYQFVSDDCADDDVHNGEMMSAINTAMSKLKPKYKEIAVMYFKENQQYVDIAKVLEIPLNTVKVTILRIREALQASLKAEYQMINE